MANLPSAGGRFGADSMMMMMRSSERRTRSGGCGRTATAMGLAWALASAWGCTIESDDGRGYGFGAGPPSASSGGGGFDVDPIDGDTDADDEPEPTGQPLNSCCEASHEGGCRTAAIEACVCDHDASCCEDAWSPWCVEQVSTLGCGECAADDGPPAGGCCQANGTPGCDDDAIAACVCAQEPACCEVGWNPSCVQAVDLHGCGTCGGGGDDDGGGNDDGGANDDGGGNDGGGGGGHAGGCCNPQPGPGCGDPFVEFCVCISDPYCCFVEWDPFCVDAVTELGCGSC